MKSYGRYLYEDSNLFICDVQVNRNVFSYALVDAKTMLLETSKTVRGNALIESIKSFVEQLNMSCDHVESLGPNGQPHPVDERTGERLWSSEGLRHFSARTAFDAIFSTVFGRNSEHVFNSQLAFTNFEIFHKYVPCLVAALRLYSLPPHGACAKCFKLL
jgi:hypothetical protein